MSHIYVISPSSAQRDKPALRRGVARLKALGHEVELDRDALATHMRFAGDDATRVASLHRAAASGADAVLTTRGGYGLSRLLGDINYKVVAKAVASGTRFVGYSDFTAFQNALLAKTGAISWAGPTLGEDFGVDGQPDEIMLACFGDLLSGQGEGAGWRLPKPRARKAPTPPEVVKPFRTVRNALLWGGNLATLVSLIGTPYFPQIKGGVLFLEDVAEHPYRVERMLTQLLHAGVLARQKALLLGQFTRYQLAPNDKGYKLRSAFDWLQTKLKIPLLTNLPFGHVPTKVLLPIGASVDLMVDGRDALLYWGGHG